MNSVAELLRSGKVVPNFLDDYEIHSPDLAEGTRMFSAVDFVSGKCEVFALTIDTPNGGFDLEYHEVPGVLLEGESQPLVKCATWSRVIREDRNGSHAVERMSSANQWVTKDARMSVRDSLGLFLPHANIDRLTHFSAMRAPLGELQHSDLAPPMLQELTSSHVLRNPILAQIVELTLSKAQS